MKLLSLTFPGLDGKSTVVVPPDGANLPLYTNRYLILNNFLTLFFSLIAIISIGMLLWGGIQLIISEGDKQKVQTARGRITYAIIGLIVALSAFVIFGIIGEIFGVKLLEINLGTER